MCNVYRLHFSILRYGLHYTALRHILLYVLDNTKECYSGMSWITIQGVINELLGEIFQPENKNTICSLCLVSLSKPKIILNFNLKL